MELRGVFWCQDCGATGTNLTQDFNTKRVTCSDVATCTAIQEMSDE